MLQNGLTPLHLTAQEDRVSAAEVLQGASVNAKTKNGYTPLHQAAQQGNTHIINVLLQHGARISKLNYFDGNYCW
uniref:Uncharacterized protein n=1 Tax=Mola mola TaxID=94237 RepID=A0A3Q3WC37_MOLML